MKKVNVTTDMIIGIASNLGGYMGRSLMTEHLSATLFNSQSTPLQLQTSNKEDDKNAKD